jgi:hypothetical protein
MEQSARSFPPSPVVRMQQSGTYAPSTPISIEQADNSPHDKEKYVVETVRPITSASDEEQLARQDQDAEWRPGFFAQFPVLGFASLLIALCCAAGSVATLLISDGKSQTHWPEKLAPNVILSGLNSVANICYGIAIGRARNVESWDHN